MQDNDFEKQVHQKMGELRLLPSGAVWEQVERRLHRKEKRRGWIIWLPLLLSALFLGGYFSQHTLPSSKSNRIETDVKHLVQKQTDNNSLNIDDRSLVVLHWIDKQLNEIVACR